MISPLAVKVCGLRDEQDIRDLAELPIDYMGFVFADDSPRFYGENLTLLEQVKPKVTQKMVAVVRNAAITRMDALLSSGLFECIQLHGEESRHCVEMVKNKYPHVEIIKAFGLTGNFDFSLYGYLFGLVHMCLFDNVVPGSGTRFDWELLRSYHFNTPFLLAGGIGPKEVEKVKGERMHLPHLVGVDVSSKFETSPGKKDTVAIRKFVEELRA